MTRSTEYHRLCIWIVWITLVITMCCYYHSKYELKYDIDYYRKHHLRPLKKYNPMKNEDENVKISLTKRNHLQDEDVLHSEYNQNQVNLDASDVNKSIPFSMQNAQKLQQFLPLGITQRDWQKCSHKWKQGNIKRRLPSIIVFGVSKCGTRAIISFLSHHPGIGNCPYISQPEINFFNDHYNEGLEWYRRSMPYSAEGQMTLEKSPSYFQESEVPSRIHKMNSTIKLIVVVCNPTRRTISSFVDNHKQVMNMKKQGRLFEMRISNGKMGELDRNYHSFRASCYGNSMKNWLDVFPLEQILVLDGDILRTDPYLEMIKIEKFLGLQSFFRRDHFVYVKEKGFFCLNDPVTGINCLGEGKGRPHPAVKPELKGKMDMLLKECNQDFLKMINRSFDWY